jgi:hypothetical protein
MLISEYVAHTVFGGDHESEEGQFEDPDIDG